MARPSFLRKIQFSTKSGHCTTGFVVVVKTRSHSSLAAPTPLRWYYDTVNNAPSKIYSTVLFQSALKQVFKMRRRLRAARDRLPVEQKKRHAAHALRRVESGFIRHNGLICCVVGVRHGGIQVLDAGFCCRCTKIFFIWVPAVREVMPKSYLCQCILHLRAVVFQRVRHQRVHRG